MSLKNQMILVYGFTDNSKGMSLIFIILVNFTDGKKYSFTIQYNLSIRGKNDD